MRDRGRPLRFIVGRDTRESGEWIRARARARRCAAAGATVTTAGVDPDAGRRLRDPRDGLRRRHRHLGLAQSVPGQRHQGVLRARARSSPKRSSARSRRSSPIELDRAGGSADVPVDRTDVIDAYIAHARLALPDPQRLGAPQIAVDTANGATTTVAPRLFEELGFDVAAARRVARWPQHQPRLRIDASGDAARGSCVEHGCRLGVAFDGDGDRAIFVDADGRDRRRRRRAADVRQADEGRRAGCAATASSRR